MSRSALRLEWLQPQFSLVKKPNQQKINKENIVKDLNMGAAIAIGAGIGAALGVAMDNIAVGVGIGVAIGVAMGAAAEARRAKKSDDN